MSTTNRGAAPHRGPTPPIFPLKTGHPGTLHLQQRTDIGVIVHTLIAHFVVDPPEDLYEHLRLQATLALGCSSNRRRILARHTANLAYAYLIEHAPTGPWRLLDPERPQANTTADAVWRHPDGWVLLDEIKTSGPGVKKIRKAWTRQARRHNAKCNTRPPHRLLGTRIIHLQQPALTRLVLPSADLRPTAVTLFPVNSTVQHNRMPFVIT